MLLERRRIGAPNECNCLSCTAQIWHISGIWILLHSFSWMKWVLDFQTHCPLPPGAECMERRVFSAECLYTHSDSSCVRVPFKGCIKIQSLPSHSVLSLSNIIGREFTSSSKAPFQILIRLHAQFGRSSFRFGGSYFHLLVAEQLSDHFIWQFTSDLKWWNINSQDRTRITMNLFHDLALLSALDI